MNAKEQKAYDEKSRLQTHNKKLIEEVAINERVLRLLVIAGHLDQDRLDQATELAGGI